MSWDTADPSHSVANEAENSVVKYQSGWLSVVAIDIHNYYLPYTVKPFPKHSLALNARVYA
jgi:hypothetical protein